MKKKKVLFISSSGGHLNELLQLENIFSNYDYHIITEKNSSTLWVKDKYQYRANYLLYGTRYKPITYIFILLLNCFKSLYLFIKIRPKVIISTGAHTAGPMCCIGKIFGSKIIFIESYANINFKSVTGKFVYLFADLFLVQWKSMLKIYPKAKYFGGVF